MRGRLRQILIAILAVAAGAAPARAGGTADLTAGLAAWRDGHRDEAIRLYTAALQDPLLSRSDQVLAHVSRAAALQLGGDYQEAIADYDSAIRLQPVPSLYRYRGIAYLAWGRLEDAADDFVQMLGLDPVNAEAAIWLHIARQKAGGGDGPELAGNVQKVDLARWPGPVLSYMAGRGSLEDATRAAQTDDLAIRAQRRCQLAFFLGEERLNDGDPEALRLLREARDICPPESAERALARMDLLRGGR